MSQHNRKILASRELFINLDKSSLQSCGASFHLTNINLIPEIQQIKEQQNNELLFDPRYKGTLQKAILKLLPILVEKLSRFRTDPEPLIQIFFGSIVMSWRENDTCVGCFMKIFEDGSFLSVTTENGVINRSEIVHDESDGRKINAVLNLEGTFGEHEYGLDLVGLDWLAKDLEQGSCSVEGAQAVLLPLRTMLEKGTSIARTMTLEDRHDLIQKSTQAPQLISGGWEGHCVAFVLYKGNLLICNKEAFPERGSDLCTSILHLKIKSRTSALNALSLIVKASKKSREEGMRIIYNDLVTQEGVFFDPDDDLFKGFKQVRQRQANCWIMSPRTGVYGALVLLCREYLHKYEGQQKSILLDKIGLSNLSAEARRMARQIYKSTFSASTSLRNMGVDRTCPGLEAHLKASDAEDDSTG